MTDYLTNSTDLTSVADAIRTKGGTSNDLVFPNGFVTAIENIPSGSSGIQVYIGYTDYKSSALGATDLKLTVETTGTYTVSWTGCRNTSSGTSGSQLYIGSTAYGEENTSFTSNYWQNNKLTGVSLTAGQVITVYAQARSSSYHMFVGNLIIQKTS